MQVYRLKAVSVLIIGDAVGIFVLIYVAAQLYHFVDGPTAVFYECIEVGNTHVGVLFDKHIFVEEGRIHHVEHIRGYVARREIKLSVYGRAFGERCGPPRFFKIDVFKIEKVLSQAFHGERGACHAVSGKNIEAVAGCHARAGFFDEIFLVGVVALGAGPVKLYAESAFNSRVSFGYACVYDVAVVDGFFDKEFGTFNILPIEKSDGVVDLERVGKIVVNEYACRLCRFGGGRVGGSCGVSVVVGS